MNNLNQIENQNESYITITENSMVATKATLNETTNFNSDINYILEEYEKISETFHELNNE